MSYNQPRNSLVKPTEPTAYEDLSTQLRSAEATFSETLQKNIELASQLQRMINRSQALEELCKVNQKRS